ncbi:hypothetical protein SOCE836_095010 [Sorangium cellulosum]|uniref:Uncharacterized protein n=2 Tax=Polyangiaceae TaxID=49 RepID=A0A4P2R2P9_SORCE|nr:hypothetical protein SOCE836_095010 [Sorangium cellulosum]WCQ96568.1 hypothetical protein NQZ70_09355 [Sorangium sp. Soce836]
MRSSACFVSVAVVLTACGDGLEAYGVAAPRTDDNAVWLWTGESPDAPACPGHRLDFWEGWADMGAVEECGVCTCGPALCTLPSSVTAHRSLRCGDYGTQIAFDDQAADEEQSGVCRKAAPPVPGEVFASVTFEPPTLAAECVASPSFDPPPISARFAKACPMGLGIRQEHEWQACISPEDDGTCPPGFKFRWEFKERIADARTCTPCSCEAPVGGSCEAELLVYAETSCTTKIIGGGFGVDQNDNRCTDLDPLPIAAMRAVLTRQRPGTCAPTSPVSRVIGDLVSGERRVFCCSNNFN